MSGLDQIAVEASGGGGVRRHHTITAATRLGRMASRGEPSDEQDWNEDEFVSEDWVGGVGAVGEKSQLHRQASLPTRYHRQFQNAGNSASSPLNSLSTIAGHDGDEDDWIKDINDQHAEQQQQQQQVGAAPTSSHGSPPQMGRSPPTPDSAVRRHVSLTYGAQTRANNKKTAALKRSDTLQTPLPQHPPEGGADPDLYLDEGANPYSYDEPRDFEDDHHYQKTPQPAPAQPAYGRSSPWSQPQGSEWRGQQPPAGAVDDVTRVLSSMDLNNQYPSGYIAPTQSPHPPRFNHSGTSPYRSPPPDSNDGRPPQDGRRTPGGSPWEQHLTGRRSNPNMQQYGHNKTPSSGSSASVGHGSTQPQAPTSIPSVPPIPQQYLPQQGSTRPGLGVTTNVSPSPGPLTHTGQTPIQPVVSTPIDVPTLVATKGYNPAQFDTRPAFARYFVIKSYTEDDVHKSLKYEIWSSTDPGNKRLDKAFKECAGRGPIYLFFSVNASGHFCGVAEMLTPLDYTRSSTVWASDKWKGVFKVRWIFVRDIPNVTLRHIKLNNTQERKPVTNSRDTQELLPDAGQEMLRIFHTHPARTSLLQDFAYYEIQAMQKTQQGTTHGQASPAPGHAPVPGSTPPLQAPSPNPSHRQPSPQPSQYNQQTYNVHQNPNALAYTMPQMSPMVQMQMMANQLSGPGAGVGVGSGGTTLSAAQSQAMHNSVMRNPAGSPQNNNPW